VDKKTSKNHLGLSLPTPNPNSRHLSFHKSTQVDSKTAENKNKMTVMKS